MIRSIYDARIAAERIKATEDGLAAVEAGLLRVFLAGDGLRFLVPQDGHGLPAYSEEGGKRVTQGVHQKQFWLNN